MSHRSNSKKTLIVTGRVVGNSRHLRPAIWTLVCVALLAVLVRAQAELQWAIAVLALFWHYIWPVIFLTLLIVAHFFRSLRGAVAGVLVAGFVILGGAIALDLSANAKSGAHTPPLRVITFNWLGGGRDRSDFFAWVEKERPDILCIQEFPGNSPAAVLALQRTLPFVSESKGDVVIFSRFPLAQERGANFHWRPIVEVTALTDNGPVQVYGVHAPTLRDVTGVLRRNVYLDGLMEFIKDSEGSKIVLGDFNSTRWDPYVSRINRKLGLHEAPALFPDVTRVLAHRFGLDWGSPIDHVMVSRGVKVDECHTGPSLGSDHRPLICVVRP